MTTAQLESRIQQIKAEWDAYCTEHQVRLIATEVDHAHIEKFENLQSEILQLENTLIQSGVAITPTKLVFPDILPHPLPETITGGTAQYEAEANKIETRYMQISTLLSKHLLEVNDIQMRANVAHLYGRYYQMKMDELVNRSQAQLTKPIQHRIIYDPLAIQSKYQLLPYPDRYPFDPTGTSLKNRVTETYTLKSTNDGSSKFVLPSHAPFYLHGLSVRIRQENGEYATLYIDEDFHVTGSFGELGETTQGGLSLGLAIVFDDPMIQGEVVVEYQTLGGQFTMDSREYAMALSKFIDDPYDITYQELIGRPLVMEPMRHLLDASTLVGMESIDNTLNRLVDVLTTLTQQNESNGGASDALASLLAEAEKLRESIKTTVQGFNTIKDNLTTSFNRLSTQFSQLETNIRSDVSQQLTTAKETITQENLTFRNTLTADINRNIEEALTAIRNRFTQAIGDAESSLARRLDEAVRNAIASLPTSEDITRLASDAANDAIANAMTDVGNALNDINAKVNEVNQIKQSLDSKLQELTESGIADIDEIKRQIQELQNSTPDLTQALQPITESINAVSTKLTEHIQAYTNAVAGINNSITAHARTLGEHDTKLQTLETAVGKVDEKITQALKDQVIDVSNIIYNSGLWNAYHRVNGFDTGTSYDRPSNSIRMWGWETNTRMPIIKVNGLPYAGAVGSHYQEDCSGLTMTYSFDINVNEPSTFAWQDSTDEPIELTPGWTRVYWTGHGMSPPGYTVSAKNQRRLDGNKDFIIYHRRHMLVKGTGKTSWITNTNYDFYMAKKRDEQLGEKITALETEFNSLEISYNNLIANNTFRMGTGGSRYWTDISEIRTTPYRRKVNKIIGNGAAAWRQDIGVQQAGKYVFTAMINPVHDSYSIILSTGGNNPATFTATGLTPSIWQQVTIPITIERSFDSILLLQSGYRGSVALPVLTKGSRPVYLGLNAEDGFELAIDVFDILGDLRQQLSAIGNRVQQVTDYRSHATAKGKAPLIQETGVFHIGNQLTFMNNADSPVSDIDVVNGTNSATVRLSDDSALLESNKPIAAPNFKITSDVNMKTDVQPLDVADILSRFDSIYGYQYRLKDSPEELHYGFLAQEVQEAYPVLVSQVNDHLTISPTGLVSVLWEMVKRQQRELDELKDKINQLTNVKET